MDNPGEWPEFTYHPKYKVAKNGTYTHHCIPTGSHPVPANLQGKRVIKGNNGDWELHYKEWTPDSGDHRNWSSASATNLFPASRKVMLNYALLRKMGLTKNRIIKL
jgi:hypothetical protein